MTRRARTLALAAALAVAAVLTGCGGSDDGSASSEDASPLVTDSGPIHVHGLGINPKDRALFVATHTGLFRAAEGEEKSARVADRYQDTMGFTVVGPDRFLGSGHPDLQERLPPFLGLIASDDAGETWRPVSLQGRRDFHVLESAGRRIYGYGSDFQSRKEALLVSSDGGRSWQQRSTPEPLLALAIDPVDRDRILASGARGMHVSADAGRTWRPVPGPSALVVWRRAGGLVAADTQGNVLRSAGPGDRWIRVGEIAGEPAALEAVGEELYVALHDGTIKRSQNGGMSWKVRARP